MDEIPDLQGKEELKTWIKQRLDEAVHELMKRGVVESIVVEAKPAWVFPFQILIGKIRDRNHSSSFDWFICGDVPTDHLNSAAASTPRDVARHFALKWQLDAARQTEDPGSQLADKAEALYELADEPGLWQQ